MRIYIAGPYTKGDVAQNVNNACAAANIIAQKGHVPFVPHLTHFWHLIYPHPYEFWLEQDLMWLDVCDALLRLPGESSGADNEVEVARKMGLTIYYNIDEISA